MNTRRKFIIQGGLATTAMLALKPFNAIANASSTFEGFCGGHRNLVFLYTSHLHPVSDNSTIQYIASLKKNNANTILLNAGNGAMEESCPLNYDASMETDEYRIVCRGAFKTGIITAAAGEQDVVQRVNGLAAYLKKERGCNVVVCLSQLGYKNKKGTDDIKLASASTNLDMIIGGDADNFTAHPMIVLNNKKAEVIIHSAAAHSTACGKIEIGFDEQSRKKNIGFVNRSSKSRSVA